MHKLHIDIPTDKDELAYTIIELWVAWTLSIAQRLPQIICQNPPPSEK